MSAMPDQGRLLLDGELNIYTVAEMKPRVLELLATSDAPCLDLSGVTELDTAGLQLLILLQREAERAGKRLRCLDPSPEVESVLRLCSLAERFTDTPGATA